MTLGEPIEAVKELRHSLYLPDGDVAISAPTRSSTGCLEIFRLHRTVVSEHSEVLGHVLLALASEKDQERYDGVPRFRLSDDAEDLAILLQSFYDIGCLQLVPRHPDTPVRLHGVMKLAVKYKVNSVRTAITQRIEQDWPLTLLDWTKQRNEMVEVSSVLHKYIEPKNTKPLEEYSFPEPASAIRFAIEYNCPSILPAAFYELATSNDARHREPSAFSSSTPLVPIRWNLLEKSDLLRLIAGEKALQRLLAKALKAISHETKVFGCKRNGSYYPDGVSRCAKAVDEYLATLSVADIPSTDPLGCLKALEEMEQRALEVHWVWDCFLGQEMYEATIKKEMQKIWDKLPKCFNLTNIANDG